MRTRACLITAAAFVLSACASIQRPAPSVDEIEAALSRQILVTTRQSNSGAEGLVGDPSTLYLRRPGYGPTPRVDRILDDIGRDFGIDRVDGWLISSLGVYCEVYELPQGRDFDEILRRVGSDPRVESAQSMQIYETQSLRYNDPYASMQPALDSLSIEAAHEHVTGRGVTVAVIDSMVDDRHPEFRGRVAVRRDLARDHRSADRAEIHGTAIAGIIASTANNGQGIVGVAPDAEVVSLRACWTVDAVTGRAMCSSFSVARSLEMAMELGVDIVNLSLSGPHDPLLEQLIDIAVDSGVIVVAAVSDGGRSGTDFPASHPAVIAAASSDFIGLPMPNRLAAPGNEVISTAPGSEYGFFSGNSMASAFVAGVAALIIEQWPGMGAGDVMTLLAETSTSGMINACLAVTRVAGGAGCPPVASESLALRNAD